MKQLKDIGFGKSSMEDMILDEVEDLSQLLLKVKIQYKVCSVKKETKLNQVF